MRYHSTQNKDLKLQMLIVITGSGNPHMSLVGINTQKTFWRAVLPEKPKTNIQQISNHLCTCGCSTVFTSVQRKGTKLWNH